MPVIPYPGIPRHFSVELQPIAAARVNRSALSNARQALDMGYSWWQAAVTVTAMEVEDALEWRVFFGRLRGPVNSFHLPVTGEPQHDGGFVVRARGAGSGYSLSSDGWPASSTVLKAGQMVTVGEQLMTLDADVKTSAAGIATLQFHSPLRGVVADDMVIETAMPFLNASLPDGAPALKLTVDLIQDGFGFSALEAY
ncbi:MAG: hypothetical protein CMN72_07705 [Sphingomonas sp.]|nr:hypothetical protein [Sphingomonas sp.]